MPNFRRVALAEVWRFFFPEGMVMGKTRSILGLLLGALVLTLIGCGPGRGDITGKVSYQGKPLRSGTVSVLGSDGVPKSGLINQDGTYTIHDAPAGSIKALVTSADPGESQPAVRIQGTPQPKVDRSGWFAIPEKYGDFEKSGLTFELKSGPNTWDIDMK